MIPAHANLRRRRAAARAPAGPLREALAAPVPDGTVPLDELPLLAVDLETTGLDATRDRVVAMAWVPLDGLRIDLSGAQRLLVAAGRVGSSATVHGLTDDVVAKGVTPREALDRLLEALTGRVLLAHHAALEVDFLCAACLRVHGAPFVTASVDTLLLQRRVLAGALADGPEPAVDALRLPVARERYGLPRYRTHDPLADAMACAELYLAQVAELSLRSREPLTFKAVRAT